MDELLYRGNRYRAHTARDTVASKNTGGGRPALVLLLVVAIVPSVRCQGEHNYNCL